MPYVALAFIAVSIFALVHLFAEKMYKFDRPWHAKILSFGGGISIAYVFIDILPKLAKSDILVKTTLPFLEEHVYILALAGFLLFYLVDQGEKCERKQDVKWLTLGLYTLFNLSVGYAVVDKDNPEVEPLLLFTIALALHYFVIDYHLTKAHGTFYREKGKWIVIGALYAGWLLGLIYTLPATAIALASAFIGGGVIMNVMRHELPAKTPHSVYTFLTGAILYTIILLVIG